MTRNFLLITSLLICSISYSQFIHNVGLKTGLSISNQISKNEGLTLTSEDGYDYRPGLSIGLTAEMFRQKNFSIITDLGYIQKGIKFEPGYTLDPNTEEIQASDIDQVRYDFLNLNLLAKYRIEFGNISPHIIAGPRLDFFLNYNKYNQPPHTYTTDYHPVVLGLTYGLGMDYNVSDFILGFEAVHQPDFTNFSEFEAGIPSDVFYSSSKTKNKAFAFLLSVRYKLGE